MLYVVNHATEVMFGYFIRYALCDRRNVRYLINMLNIRLSGSAVFPQLSEWRFLYPS